MDPKAEADSRVIVEKAVEFGASLAGIASAEALKASPSYGIYDRSPYYEGYTGVKWSAEAKSVVVLALQVDPAEPGLDWWSDRIPGRTPGNRLLMKTSRHVQEWLGERLGVRATPLAYAVERGGIFLKDAAVLAGLGVIGTNNLFLSREYGTRIRLRGLFLDTEVTPTEGFDFVPCDGCARPCERACPENAFHGGRYDRTRCEREMQRNRDNPITVEGATVGMDGFCRVVPFCRACELACPVAVRDV